MAYYEHLLIARQDISSQAVDQLAEEFAEDCSFPFEILPTDEDAGG